MTISKISFLNFWKLTNKVEEYKKISSIYPRGWAYHDFYARKGRKEMPTGYKDL